MSERPPSLALRPSGALRHRSRRFVVTAAVVLPTVGVLSASGASLEASHDTRFAMAYDRADVIALHGRLAAAQRAKTLDWHRGVSAFEDTRRSADRRRASRGEPRQALTVPMTSGQYWRPTTGPLTQTFHPGHDGIDIGVPVGTPVVAAADGVVTFAGEQSGYGTHVEVRHADGTVTTYSHLSEVDTIVGQKVRAGQQIAQSGNSGHSTGPHLHFEVHPTEGTLTDPIAWLRAHGAW